MNKLIIPILLNLFCLAYAMATGPLAPRYAIGLRTEQKGTCFSKPAASGEAFAQRESLHGVIEGGGEVPDHKGGGEVPDQINVFFTGTVSLYVSGNQAGIHNPAAQSVLLKIPVKHFPVVI